MTHLDADVDVGREAGLADGQGHASHAVHGAALELEHALVGERQQLHHDGRHLVQVGREVLLRPRGRGGDGTDGRLLHRHLGHLQQVVQADQQRLQVGSHGL